MEIMSPGGPVIYFNVTVRATGTTEDETVTFRVSDYSPSEGANLTVFVPSGGSFSFVVLSFNSFGSLGITREVNVMALPPGNF